MRSQFGYHIILSLWHHNPTLESGREELKAYLSDQKLADLVYQKAREAVVAVAGQEDIRGALKNLDFTVEIRETGLRQRDEAMAFSDLSYDMMDEIFSIREIGLVGNPVDHAQGVAVPRLLEVELPRPGTFQEFRQQAEADYMEAKVKELMAAEAEKLSAEGIRQANLTAAAKAQGFSVSTSQEFTVNGTPDQVIGYDSSFNRAAFALETGAVSTPQTVQDNVVVFQVKSRSPFDEAAFERQQTTLRAQLLENRQDTYFQEYVSRAREELFRSRKITINQRALDQASLVF